MAILGKKTGGSLVGPIAMLVDIVGKAHGQASTSTMTLPNKSNEEFE